MSSLVMNAASMKYIKVPVAATVDGVSYDPTGDIVQFAFVAGKDIHDSDWVSGSWETTASGKYFARCLIGPGGTIIVAPGKWNVYMNVVSNPEAPADLVGSLVIEGVSPTWATALGAACLTS